MGLTFGSPLAESDSLSVNDKCRQAWQKNAVRRDRSATTTVVYLFCDSIETTGVVKLFLEILWLFLGGCDAWPLGNPSALRDVDSGVTYCQMQTGTKCASSKDEGEIRLLPSLALRVGVR